MSTQKKSFLDGKSKDEPPESDVYAGRLNFDLVRSQQALRSFYKSKPATVVANTAAEDDDTDFLEEPAGLGTKPKAVEIDGAFGGVLNQKTRSSGDKLLEQILGKKAAQAKRKELRGSQVANSARGADAVRPKPAPHKKDEDDSEEEGGRAAAFTSKRQKPRDEKVAVDATIPVEGDAHEVNRDIAVEDDSSSVSRAVQATGPDSEDDPRPTKKRAGGGYLDELLAAKAKKKKKNKKQKSAG